VELLYTMYCDVVGLPLPKNRVQTYRGGKWVQLLNDFRSALYFWRKGELTLFQYLRSLRNIKVFAIWSLSDPAPFGMDVWSKVLNGIRKKFRPNGL
jgi:D-aspartate ligase